MRTTTVMDSTKKASPTFAPVRGRTQSQQLSWLAAPERGTVPAADMSREQVLQGYQGHDFSNVSIYPTDSTADREALGSRLESCPLALPSPRVCPFGGACHTCPTRLQAKLTINQPEDEYEREANRVADAAMQMPDYAVRWAPRFREGAGLLRTKSSPAQNASLVQRRGELYAERQDPLQTILGETAPTQRAASDQKGEQDLLQIKAVHGVASGIAPGVVPGLLPFGGGQPLPEPERAFFETRLGEDLGSVRVHTGPQAANVARFLGAEAFAFGPHVVFAPGRYSPETHNGKRLLAHEITHVIQQRTSRGHIQRYEETRKPVSPLSEAARLPTGPMDILHGARCLGDLTDPPMQDATREWIQHACRLRPNGYLPSREWDAFGHCWISCEGSRRCGVGVTAVLGTARELYRESQGKANPHDSFSQDLHNQSIGRALAFKPGTCSALCDGAHLDLTAPLRVCMNCSTYPRSGSRGPCPPWIL
jgi:hypothetical protein